MVVGHPRTLEKLHDMGYKTFNGIINESYDSRNLIERVDIIINNLRMLHILKDKWAWLEPLKDICIHNKKVLLARNFFESNEYKNIIKIYQGV
jgi:hypothetical protein